MIYIFPAYESRGQSPHDLEKLGPELFIEQRCVRCHTIGRGRFVGPDLKGVGKRYTQQELIKWIEDPQAVYAEKGTMPVNPGYPPMPPTQIHPMAARAIAQYLLNAKVSSKAESGTIAGKIINKTSDTPVQNVALDLKAYMGDNETDKYETSSAADGSFEFKNLPWDRSYEVSIKYDGAQYATDKMVFNPGEDVKTLELPVYDPTMSDANISVTEGHMIIEIAEDGTLNVGDISIFDNKGNTMFVGSKDLGDGKKESLRFSVPPDAGNLTFMHGLDAGAVVMTATGFSDTGSVVPGEKRVIFAYMLPLGNGKSTVEKTIEYPTGSLLLLVSETKDEVEVTGLEGGEEVQMDNFKYLKWAGTDLKPGHKITVTFVTPGGLGVYVGEYIKWAALGFVVLLIGGGILYSSMARGRKSSSAEPYSREFLLKKRDTLIRDIASLDDEYEAGRVEEGRYRELRDSMKRELVEVTRRLRF